MKGISLLVSNAIKYAPNSKVLVGVRRRKGTLCVVVSDSGPGIAAKDHKRVFQEFVQVGVSQGMADGLGLGLSIVRRLADMLGLSVPGQGAHFFIEGLVEVQPQHIAMRRTPRSLIERLKGIRVLVVDDNRAVLDSTVHLLTRWGCLVRATAHTQRPFNAADIDFVLCDQDLAGELAGLDVVRALRGVAGNHVGAAIVTGGRLDHLGDICKAENIALLSKPVRPSQLRSALISGITAQTSPSSDAIPAAAERVETPSALSSPDT